MNTLCQEKKIQILNALTEGCSIHRIERMTGVHRDTIMRLGVEVGSRCAQSLDQKLTDLSVEEAEIDEIWCYVGKKQKHVTALDNEREGGETRHETHRRRRVGRISDSVTRRGEGCNGVKV